MPEILPFRALHYAAGELTKIVTQPYDRIDAKLQRAYYDRHPHNFIRIDKPADVDPYGAAARTLDAWTREGVLVRDREPALYAYHQVHGGQVRKGMTALVRIEDRIHKHEETHTGPKADRLEMIKATRAHISHVFLLYSDPPKTVNRTLDDTTWREPMLSATDDFGETHRVWRVDDPVAVSRIRGVLATKDAIIADGHHRYETSINYRNLMRARGARCDGESFEYVLATLVNMDDGLTIFGTHRVIHGLPQAPDLSRVAETFDVSEPADVKAALAGETSRPAFGLVEPGRVPRLLVVRDVAKAAAQVKPPSSTGLGTTGTAGKATEGKPKSEAWRSLDVNILHTVILEGMLGITPEHTAKEMYVDYLRSADEAIERVRSGRAQVAFLVNPVRMDQIRSIVAQGERFPQKTTDFYPKLLSGLLMCPLNFV